MKFGVRKAFFIRFEMATSRKGISASDIGVRYSITEKTARLIRLKVHEVMESSGNHPMDDTLHVNMFVICGVKRGKIGRSYDTKKKKTVTEVQLTGD